MITFGKSISVGFLLQPSQIAIFGRMAFATWYIWFATAAPVPRNARYPFSMGMKKS